jgi:hypothetical protein
MDASLIAGPYIPGWLQGAKKGVQPVRLGQRAVSQFVPSYFAGEIGELREKRYPARPEKAAQTL